MLKNKKDLLPKLIFLFFITTSLVSTLSMAKFQSTVAGVNSANAAAFVVQVTSLPENSNEIVLDCKNNYNPMPIAEYKIKVSNKNKINKISQVGCKYSIIVTLPEMLPEGVEMTVSDTEDVVISENKLEYTFKSRNIFLPSVASEYINIIKFSANENVTGYHNLKNINIKVVSEQID